MFKLFLLDAQPEQFSAGVVISAFAVVDGAGRLVAGANSESEAKRKRDRFALLYPDRSFYVTAG